MQTEKYITALVGTQSTLVFFQRLAQAFAELGYTFSYVVYDYNIYRQWSKIGQSAPIELATYEASDIEIDVSESLEVRSKSLSPAEALESAQATYLAQKRLAEKAPPELLFTINESNVLVQGMTAWAKQANVPVLYFELSNLPNRIQVDPTGTNARMSILSNPSELQQLPQTTPAFEKWKSEYIKKCQSSKFTSRSKAITSLHFDSFVTLYGKVFKKVVRQEKRSIKSIITNKLRNRLTALRNDPFDITENKYALFPAQVASDTQLWINSEINNIQGVEKALETAKSKGLKLVVKIHPKENDWSEIKKIYSLKEKYPQELFFVDCSIYQLIKNAELVITINSSAGVEARLWGKEVISFSPSFYRDLDDNLLARFIEHYLIPIDFFGNAPIDKEVALKILSKV